MKKILIIFTLSLLFPLTQEVQFESANPFSLKDIITNIDNLDKQVVTGILTIPDNVTKDKFPLVGDYQTGVKNYTKTFLKRMANEKAVWWSPSKHLIE